VAEKNSALYWTYNQVTRSVPRAQIFTAPHAVESLSPTIKKARTSQPEQDSAAQNFE
jgi:hypothetical protein